MRIGHGYDIHRLGRGGKLLLGTVVVAEGIHPIAHSDGDVVAHAIVDALLGALGRGDIGEHFPTSDPKWKDAPSRIFLEQAVLLVHQARFKISNADVTILAEKPKLAPFKPQMSAALSQLLQAPVNIKAGTNESCDAVGAGKAIACHAVVLLSET